MAARDENRAVSRLHVTAASSPGAARDGNREFVHVLVSVADHDGDAVKGLEDSDFVAEAVIFAPGGSPVAVTSTHEGPSGVYQVDLEPTRPWKDGTYLVALTVEDGHDRGQTVVAAAIPE